MKTNTQDAQAMTMDADVMAVARSAFQHARAGDALILARLVEAGLPANLANEKGDTLLMLASYHGHADATRVLLEHQADPEKANDRGQTPLAGAAFKGDVTIARLLLDHGARVDGVAPDGKTALMFAAMFDRLEVLELLLSRGAAPERTDAGNRTALDYARAMGARRTTERLAELRKTNGQQRA
ncbi:ankyrin repeat domain-containing protein [Archangium violaceum]|uniref:ankyrin repeat domain-containing protein n=1 Tax=Archangium violaceum TaxID=83451 RepID=UPI00193B4E07|nr:ankyrin repeat domain-containing protein [Archangium violaceum]QRK04029.1 ankyrin repeat domain-containing protein [Archangium violaceum]